VKSSRLRGLASLPSRLGGGAWTTALTNQSSDVRSIASGTNSITVTYQNSANATGVGNFKLVESYALVADYFSWQITVTIESGRPGEGGFGGVDPIRFPPASNAASESIRPIVTKSVVNDE
jgi:hypothetical protein